MNRREFIFAATGAAIIGSRVQPEPDNLRRVMRLGSNGWERVDFDDLRSGDVFCFPDEKPNERYQACTDARDGVIQVDILRIVQEPTRP